MSGINYRKLTHQILTEVSSNKNETPSPQINASYNTSSVRPQDSPEEEFYSDDVVHLLGRFEMRRNDGHSNTSKETDERHLQPFIIRKNNSIVHIKVDKLDDTTTRSMLNKNVVAVGCWINDNTFEVQQLSINTDKQ